MGDTKWAAGHAVMFLEPHHPASFLLWLGDRTGPGAFSRVSMPPGLSWIFFLKFPGPRKS